VLAHISTRLQQHQEAVRRSIQNLLSRKTATLVTMVMMALALALPALLWVMTHYLSRMTADWQPNGQISLYLEQQLPSAKAQALLQRILALPQVEQAQLKTPDDGLKAIKQKTGLSDLVLYFSENPLPAVIQVIPMATLNTPEALHRLYDQLKGFSEVADAKYDFQWLSRLYVLFDLAKQMTRGLFLLLGTAVFLIIGNTIRLAVQQQREEIQILKLIGGTDAYIVRPFLYLGLWYGLGGALLAVLFVHLFSLSVSLAFEKLMALYQVHYPVPDVSWEAAVLLVLFSSVLGLLSSFLSVKKQITFIDPSNSVY